MQRKKEASKPAEYSICSFHPCMPFKSNSFKTTIVCCYSFLFFLADIIVQSRHHGLLRLFPLQMLVFKLLHRPHPFTFKATKKALHLLQSYHTFAQPIIPPRTPLHVLVSTLFWTYSHILFSFKWQFFFLRLAIQPFPLGLCSFVADSHLFFLFEWFEKYQCA